MAVLTRVLVHFRVSRGYTSRAYDEPPEFEKSTELSRESDPAEIAKFDAAAHRFWDVDGEFKPLHKLNPVRARYVAGTRPAARRARARCRLRRRLAGRIAGARRRHGHRHRSRAEHDRHRAPARARLGAEDRLSRGFRRKPGARARRNIRRRDLHGNARARAGPRGDHRRARHARAPRRPRVHLHHQSQFQILRAGHRRRGIPRAAGAARHA